jgi:hypothetical protein
VNKIPSHCAESAKFAQNIEDTCRALYVILDFKKDIALLFVANLGRTNFINYFF